jgi:hypothetical protein
MLLKNRNLYLLPLLGVLGANAAYAKRMLFVRGPRELFEWELWSVSPLGGATLSIFLAIEGGIIVTLALGLKGGSFKECLKSFILITLSCSLPALGYMIALCFGAWHESKTFSPFWFDFLVDYYPPAIAIGMMGAFIRGLYAFQVGLEIRKSIFLGIFYWLFIFTVLLLTTYMWGVMELLERCGSFLYLLISVIVGAFHGYSRFRKTLVPHRAISEGIGLCAFLYIGMFLAFYHERAPVAGDTYSGWRAMLVPLCTLLVFFFISSLYLNPKMFYKIKE